MTTLPAGEQTHQAVLPQQPALESVGADTPGSRDETAHGHLVAVRGAVGKHGRGETDGLGTCTRRRHVENAATAAEEAETGSGDAPAHEHVYTGGVGAGRVFVLSKEGDPLMPCHPARARELLGKGRAVVARYVPFTIRLKDRTLADSEVDGVQLRIDPGSKGTGLHLTDEKKGINEQGVTGTVRRGLISFELQHRGDQIRGRMQQRAGYRRRRRSANCRYRAPRSDNRTRPGSWLPPSLRHRVDTVFSEAARLCRYAPVAEIHVESGGFDTHSMSTGRPLRGAGYTQGTLAGTDARAYLHARWNSSCSYCGITGVPLNIEHVRPRSRGGSSRISNLVLACVPCNMRKGTLPVEVFLAASPDRLAKILQQGETPLHDAAAMNATRWPLREALSSLGRPVFGWPGEASPSGTALPWGWTSRTLSTRCPSDTWPTSPATQSFVSRPRFSSSRQQDAAPTRARLPTDSGFRGSGAPAPSSTSDTSPETSYGPPCPRASGRAHGPAASACGPEDSTASARPKAASTSPTGICGYCRGATATTTAPARNPRRQYPGKPVDRWPTGS